MAKLNIDISGRKGLLERHQGDLNDTSAKPHLRYIADDGQFADGIFNPIKKYGYLSPANAKFASLTGSVAAKINSIQYDGDSDTLFLAETGENILQLAGLDDTSLANYLSITSGDTIKDMLIYEVNSQKSLLYVIDSNDFLTEAPGNTSVNAGGMYVGFKTLVTSEGATVLEKNVKDAYPAAQQMEYQLGDVTSTNVGAGIGRKLAQEFDGGDVVGRAISGVSLSMRRSAGTGVGITIKVSIQGPASASVSPYTSKGAWGSGVSYAVNDTVTASGSTFQCHTAHTSAAGNTPPAGASAEDYWNYFGAPDGTDLASGTFTLSSVPVYASYGSDRFNVEFTTPVTVLGTGNYWIVVEEVGSNMTAGDRLVWRGTVNDTGIYTGYKSKLFVDAATDYWKAYNLNEPNTSFGLDTFDFRLIMNRDDNWTADTGTGTNSMALNAFGVQTGQDSFLYLADNSLVYWFVGNKVHSIDGTETGGPTGRLTEDLLTFSSYTSIPDATETRGRIYIAVQTSERTSGIQDPMFAAERIGVYIWDKRASVLGSNDFYPAPGAQEIKNVFVSSSGDVRAITVNNSGFCEIRGIIGNKYSVLHTMERGAFPSSRRGISVLNDMSVWFGTNGIFYAYGSIAPGEKEQLYKIGDMSAEVTANKTLTPGAIFVGNEKANAPQQAIIFGWVDTNPTYKVQKWYPNGDGTINSVPQLGNQGNVYSPVMQLGGLAQINYIRVYCRPTTSTGANTIATIKTYYNQSSTAAHSKTVTQKMASDGFFYLPLGKKSVHAVQFEIEYSTSQTLGDDDFNPMFIEVDYEPTGKKK